LALRELSGTNLKMLQDAHAAINEDGDGRRLLGRVGNWMTVVKNAASRLCWSRVGVLVARRLGI